MDPLAHYSRAERLKIAQTIKCLNEDSEPVDKQYLFAAKRLIDGFKSEALKIVHFGCRFCDCRCEYGRLDRREQAKAYRVEINDLPLETEVLRKRLEKYEGEKACEPMPVRDAQYHSFSKEPLPMPDPFIGVGIAERLRIGYAVECPNCRTRYYRFKIS